MENAGTVRRVLRDAWNRRPAPTTSERPPRYLLLSTADETAVDPLATSQDRSTARGAFASDPARLVGGLVVALAVVLLLSANRLGIMVLPAGVAGAAWAGRQRRRRGQARRGRRLAAWALYAPSQPSDASALERVLVADLAASAWTNVKALDRARAFVHRCVDDPWRRELAQERLARAAQIVLATPEPLRAGATSRLAAGCFWASALVVVLPLGRVLPPSVSIAGVAVATLVAVIAWAELCDASAYLPQQLAFTALLPTAPAPFVLSEPALVDVLTDLGGRELAVADLAVALLRTVDDGPRTARTHARLGAARDVL